MTKARMKELLKLTLSELSNVMCNYMDCDDFGDFITENFTREEAKEFDEEGWFGENDEDDLNLPEKIEIRRPNIEDLDEMDEYISNYLSDEYGFCVNSFKFDFDMRKVYIYDIDWDTTE